MSAAASDSAKPAGTPAARSSRSRRPGRAERRRPGPGRRGATASVAGRAVPGMPGGGPAGDRRDRADDADAVRGEHRGGRRLGGRAAGHRRTDAPAAGRPGSASRLSGPRAKWLTKTANEPSWPAYPHRGGTSASCSWPLATNTLPSVSVTDSGPRLARLAARLGDHRDAVTGRGRLIASPRRSGPCGNQRVVPPGVISPIWVPAAASCLASASGTSSLDTRSGVREVPGGPVVRGDVAVAGARPGRRARRRPWGRPW